MVVVRSIVHDLVVAKIVSCYGVVGGGDLLVSVKNVRKVIGHRFHIAKRHQWVLIKELEVLGLLEVRSGQTIKIFK